MQRPAWILLCGLAVCAFFGAGVGAWSLIGSALIMLAGALAASLRPASAPHRGVGIAVAVTSALLLLWVLPLPFDLAAWRVPDYGPVEQAWQSGATLDVAAPGWQWLSLGINPAGALRILVLWCAVCATAFAVARCHAEERHVLLNGLLVLGAVVATAGLLSRFVWPAHAIWWFQASNSNGLTLGPFVSRNHYGVWLSALVPVAGALALRAGDQGRKTQTAVYVLAAMLLIAGGMASHARGAYLSLLLALPLLGLTSPKRLGPAAGLLLGGLACLGLLVAAAMGSSRFEARLQGLTQAPLGQRAVVWGGALAAWQEAPLLGLGPQGFRLLSTQHVALETATHYAHHAESTPLQILAEGGLVGAVLVLGLALSLGFTAYQAGRTDPGSQAGRMAAKTALLLIALHALYDVPFHVPLYAFTAAVFTGMMLPPPALHREAASRLRAAWPILLAVALVLAVGLRYGEQIHSRDKYRRVAQADLPALMEQLRWTPTYWAAWYHIARRSEARASEARLTDTEEAGYLALAALAQRRATALHPRHPELWIGLAKVRARRGDIPGANAAYDRYRELTAGEANDDG